MRESKVDEFINSRQGSMLMNEYSPKFTQLGKFVLALFPDFRARMSNIITSVSDLVVKKYGNAMLIEDMDIAYLTHA